MSERLYEAMGDISERHIREAKQISYVRKPIWHRWGLVAACLALVVMLGALGHLSLSGSPGDETGTTVIGGIERHYKKNSVYNTEIGRIWPWEYQTISERYSAMTFEGREYRTRARAIGAGLLGEVLGTCTAKGYDIYTDATYTETSEVRKINHVSREHLVAVGMEDVFYVYICTDNGIPSTFGEVLDLYGLAQTLEFSRYTVCEGHKDTGHYVVSDDSYIWEVLSQCRDAKAVEDSDAWDWGMGERNYLSFTATSETLGIYKKVFYITEDGYVSTNIFEYGYVYDIGVDPAEKIIAHVKANSTETGYEPYEYRLAGTLTVIGDDYVLINDSVLCVDPDDGMVFKLPTDDIRIRRSIELGDVETGDIVVVSFRGEIDVANENTIRGAVSIEEGILHDGSVVVPE